MTRLIPRSRFLFAAALATVASAHHSTAPYDLIHGTKIEGVVTQFAWENPHAHIYVDVSDGANVQHWTVEIDSPGVLRRLGWTKDTLVPGERVLVTGAKAKDGSFNMKALTIQLPNGKKMLGVPKIEN